MQRGTLTTIEGRNTVTDSLISGRNIKIIYVDKSFKNNIDKIRKLFEEAKSQSIPILFKDRKFLDKMSVSNDHQGIIAKAVPKQTRSIQNFCEKFKEDENICLVVLKSITHSHNLGAVIRSLSAFNVNGLVIPHVKDKSFLELAEKNSMGAFNDVEIIEGSFYSSLATLKRFGFSLIALEIDSDKTIYEVDLSSKKLALIFGGESDTLREDSLGICDSFVKIPMHSKISSLNLSVAVSIVCYERIRQNKKYDTF